MKMKSLIEIYNLVLESKKTEEQSLNILNKVNVPDANKILEDLKSIDKSDNQKNLPFMATIVTWNLNDSNIINNMNSIFEKYNELLKNNNIKPMLLTQNKITIGNDTFNNFLKLAEHIDGIHTDFSYIQKRKKESFIVYENEDTPLFSSNGIDVYDGTEVGKCIKYTQGRLTGKKYSFCIGQPMNTIYQSYRDKKVSTFYFIVDRNRFKTNSDGSVNLDDPLHIVVFDMTKNGIQLTDADNKTGNIAKYGTNVQRYVSYLKSKGIPVDKLVNKPKTPEEEKEDKLLGKSNKSLEWFIKLPYEMKSKYIGRGNELTDKQFDIIFKDKYLLNQYVNIGSALPEYQFKKLFYNLPALKSYIRTRQIAVKNGSSYEFYEQNLTDEQFDIIIKNDDILKQYINTGSAIPEYQFKKLFYNLPAYKTYMKARAIANQKYWDYNDYEINLTSEQFDILLKDEDALTYYFNTGAALSEDNFKIISGIPSLYNTYMIARGNMIKIPYTVNYDNHTDNYTNNAAISYYKSYELPFEYIDKLKNMVERGLDSAHKYASKLKLDEEQFIEKYYKNITKARKYYIGWVGELADLYNESSIFLEDKNISEITDDLLKLKKAEYLNLRNNNISFIPKGFSNLKLEVLSLDDNNLSEISEEICNMKTLIELTLRNNNISKIPDSIKNLRRLEDLDLRGNPLPNEEIQKVKRLLRKTDIRI